MKILIGILFILASTAVCICATGVAYKIKNRKLSMITESTLCTAWIIDFALQWHL